jgi:cation transport ATPase
MNHENHNDHSSHINHQDSNITKEYIKFILIMFTITVASIVHANLLGMTLMQFLESFMGVFFIVFAGFKIFQLKEFAYGFQSYDLLAKRSLVYAYLYPFIQLSLGLVYLLGFGNISVDIVVVVVSLLSGAGVLNSLIKKQQVHCVCLGNVIKLPLSTISFVEDFGMALMAFAMILVR